MASFKKIVKQASKSVSNVVHQAGNVLEDIHRAVYVTPGEQIKDEFGRVISRPEAQAAIAVGLAAATGGASLLASLGAGGASYLIGSMAKPGQIVDSGFPMIEFGAGGGYSPTGPIFSATTASGEPFGESRPPDVIEVEEGGIDPVLLMLLAAGAVVLFFILKG